MKYWNKSKRARKHWTVVHREHGSRAIATLKRECQLYKSTGRFYYELKFSEDTGYGHSIWWFEFPEDVTYLRLMNLL